MATVSLLSVAPVKGLGLVHPAEIQLGRDGVDDNRRFCLVDADGRRYGALRDPRLVAIGVEWDGSRLALRFAGGGLVEGEVRLDGPVETDLYRRRLAGRIVVGPWAEALSSALGREVLLIEAQGPTRSVDRSRGPFSLVSEASLEELALHAGVGRVDGRRFRMLVQVAGCGAHEEDEWIGREVRLGEAVVRPLEQVARCAITTADPESGVRDLDTLGVIRAYRGSRAGDQLDFGIYGEVVIPGRVRVGDPVEPIT